MLPYSLSECIIFSDYNGTASKVKKKHKGTHLRALECEQGAYGRMVGALDAVPHARGTGEWNGQVRAVCLRSSQSGRRRASTLHTEVQGVLMLVRMILALRKVLTRRKCVLSVVEGWGVRGAVETDAGVEAEGQAERSLLLLVPLVLGIGKLNARYIPQLQARFVLWRVRLLAYDEGSSSALKYGAIFSCIQCAGAADLAPECGHRWRPAEQQSLLHRPAGHQRDVPRPA